MNPKEELRAIEDSGMVMCWECRTLHFEPLKPCPKCGAPASDQYSTTPEGVPVCSHENIAKAFRYRAHQLRVQAQDLETRAKKHSLEVGEGPC